MPALHGLLPRVRAFLLRRQVMNEIRELTEMEVEAVSGGDGFLNIGLGLNIAAPVAVAIGGPAISIFGGSATGGGATGTGSIPVSASRYYKDEAVSGAGTLGRAGNSWNIGAAQLVKSERR